MILVYEAESSWANIKTITLDNSERFPYFRKGFEDLFSRTLRCSKKTSHPLKVSFFHKHTYRCGPKKYISLDRLYRTAAYLVSISRGSRGLATNPSSAILQKISEFRL